jgi:DNA processing protein
MSVPLPAWFDPADERTARVAWSRLTEPGDLDATRFVAECGAGPALGHVLAGTDAAGRVKERWRSRLGQLAPHRDLDLVRRYGGRVLVPGDPQWPELLDPLGERRPFCLWVRGRHDLALASARAAALVGARASTEYGELFARDLGFGCAEQGVTVVSGAAYGIDAAAHTGALSASGVTVAVLACGVDRPYPRGNADLVDRIAIDGLVVSEVPPGSAPTRNRFIHRNRLIAALAAATVVVQAAERSGSLTTADFAAEVGRAVGAVPGLVTSRLSVGTHSLIQAGAPLIRDTNDALELLANATGRVFEPAPPAPRPDLNPALTALLAAVEDGAGTLTELAETAEASRGALAGLAELERLGLVRRGFAGRWERAA